MSLLPKYRDSVCIVLFAGVEWSCQHCHGVYVSW